MEFKALPIGISDFKKMILNNYYYIDKTILIRDLLDYGGEVNLFTRPRRFGKTLNVSMLQYFFEKTEKDNSCLFNELAITKAGDKYLEHMGKYPVINITLKSAKRPTYESAYVFIKDELIKEYIRHIYILDSNKLLDLEKEAYTRILENKATESEYLKSLKFLSECLEKYYNKKVIILIDEYDVPIENSYFSGFYKEMINTIRSLFESALKDNKALKFAVITGCLRISKESIFTGLNNLEIISILNNYYSEYFGFTNKEVKQLLKDYNLGNKFELTKSWYNGYIFGKTEVYNPWSLINFIKALYKDINAFPLPHWANTSSNSIIKHLIEKADITTKLEIEELMSGKTIEKPIHEDITYDEIYNNMDNLWNFLFFTGYLKKTNERIEDTIIYMNLAIPNKEISHIYITTILKWFENKIKTKDLTIMYNAILNGDENIFNNELTKLLLDNISYYDSHESFYHGFIIGVLLYIDGYIVKLNQENGTGRSDIIIKSPDIDKVAIIIEFKIASSKNELDKKCDEALAQIELKNYNYNLQQEGYDDIIKYGIAFYRKKCKIKKYNSNRG